MLATVPKKDQKAMEEGRDITLTYLGTMKFLMSVTEEGYDLMYIRKKDFIPVNSIDKFKEEIPINYYCKHEVKLTAFDKFMGVDLSQKVSIKIGELRKWLIEQDCLLGAIQGCRRDVKL